MGFLATKGFSSQSVEQTREYCLCTFTTVHAKTSMKHTSLLPLLILFSKVQSCIYDRNSKFVTDRLFHISLGFVSMQIFNLGQRISM